LYRSVVEKTPFYDVSIPGKPAVSAKLYWLGFSHLGVTGHGGRAHLLVLTSKSSDDREFYYIKINQQEVGLPSCFKYIPLLFGAVVDRSTLSGFPFLGTLKADWEKNEREVRMRITGFSDAVQKFDPNSTSEAARRSRPIAYQRVIVFTTKEN
jgi:hypothetical protein